MTSPFWEVTTSTCTFDLLISKLCVLRICLYRVHTEMGDKMQWLFHDFSITSLNFPWLKHDETQPFWSIFSPDDIENVCSFQTARNLGTKKRNSMTFPWPRPFFLESATFPGLENAFSNSMTLHDRVNPVLPYSSKACCKPGFTSLCSWWSFVRRPKMRFLFEMVPAVEFPPSPPEIEFSAFSQDRQLCRLRFSWGFFL